MSGIRRGPSDHWEKLLGTQMIRSMWVMEMSHRRGQFRPTMTVFEYESTVTYRQGSSVVGAPFMNGGSPGFEPSSGHFKVLYKDEHHC